MKGGGGRVTPTSADCQGRGHHCPLVPWSHRGEQDGQISHQPAVARPTMARRAPQHHAGVLPGSRTPSHGHACARASSRSLTAEPTPVCMSLSQPLSARPREHHHCHGASSNCRTGPWMLESSAGSQSLAQVPQLQPPWASTRG